MSRRGAENGSGKVEMFDLPMLGAGGGGGSPLNRVHPKEEPPRFQQYSFNEVNYVRFDQPPDFKTMTSLRKEVGVTCNSLPRYTEPI